MSRVAIDIGGTFTDLVFLDEDTGETKISKVSTTPKDPTIGVIASVKKASVDMKGCDFLIHGTTVVINAVLERTGAKTALITTKGFRDVYSIGRTNRTEMYNLYYKKPEIFVPRSLTYEVSERLNYRGEVLKPVDVSEAREAANQLLEKGVHAVAVCLLNSYANPKHEEEVERIVKQRYPEVHVSLSSRIVREFREYERTSTTVINAYVMPIVASYLSNLETTMKGMGFGGQFLIMQSNGGVMTSNPAKQIPVRVIESGPAAGVIGSAYLGRTLGIKDVISFDMGGTTAKASVVVGGNPKVMAEYRIGGYARGHPIKVPVVDIVEVGTGGGSIAWIDASGALKVGPKSAGAYPGPICYGLGGTDPTVTDANVLLGRINPDRFLGGEMHLDLDGARRGVRKLANTLGLDEQRALSGILTVANSNMSLAIRAVTVERGYDQRDFAMVSFGGGGPMHAIDLARELGIPEVVVPPDPAHFSAWGMLLADLRHDYVRTHVDRIDSLDTSELLHVCYSLAELGRKALLEEGINEKKIDFLISLDMRYVGQEHAVNVPVTRDQLEKDEKTTIRKQFDKLHKERYGHSSPEEVAEIVNVRVAAIGHVSKPELRKIGKGSTRPPKDAIKGGRKVYQTAIDDLLDSAIYLREALVAGNVVSGPAVIEEYASTVVLSPGDVASVNEYGHLVVKVKKK